MVFDGLLSTHNSITHTVTSVEKIYFNQALKLLPTHVLSKVITEGWKIVVYADVNELIEIDSQLTGLTTGVTEYEMRRVFVKGVVNGRDELAFKSTLLHELTHVFDCIIDGSYCSWKSEKYYNSELENLITQEGNNFSEYARSNIKEYLSTVVSRYLLNQTDFSTVPLTKAFIEKYYFMCEDSIEQRLRNLENNAVTYIELDTTYNKLKYSKLNKENDKYVLQLPETSSGGSSTGGSVDSNVIYDNNVTFNTSVTYFALNKTTISYINQTLDSNTVGTWELKTIIGNTSAVAIQIRTFILDGRNSLTTNYNSLPNIQIRYFDYNNSRAWTSWIDKITTLETRVTNLENSGGSTGGSSGGSSTSDGFGEKLIAHYIHTGNQEIYFTTFDFTTCEGTTSEAHGLTKATEVMIVPNGWTLQNRTLNVDAIPIEWSKNTDKIKLVPVDDITLKLTKNDGSTIIPVNLSASGNANVDITKFHFEDGVTWGIDNLPINTNYIRIVIKGYIKGMTNRYLKWTTIDNDNNEIIQPKLEYYGAPKPSSVTHGVFANINIELDFRDSIALALTNNFFEGRKTQNNLSMEVIREQEYKIISKNNSSNDKLNFIGLNSVSNAFNCNGTHVYIYGLGGY